MDITEMKNKLKDRLALGLNYGLQALEESIKKDSILRNEIITFKSQFNDLNRIAGQGILGYEQVEIGYNKIRQGLLKLIEKIERADLTNQKKLPKVQNTELQNRKENFFELLKIHFNNLENLRIVLTNSNNIEKDIRTGREAISFIYKDLFIYGFKNPRSTEKNVSIEAYSADFFEEKFPRLEPYLNTLLFIMEYIEQGEIDQGFFFGVLSSILSSDEKALLLYYSLSKIAPDALDLLKESGIITQHIQPKLIETTHFEKIV